jgi:transmembrane sensor
MEHNAKRIQALMAEQAAEWVIRLEDGTSSERAEFAQWVTASPNHLAEFLNARATWEAMAGKAFDRVPETEALLTELAQGAPTNAPAALRFAQRRTGVRTALAASVAILVVAVGAIVWVTRLFDPEHAVYETAVGEQATRNLPDGSTVVLNTRTRLHLNWSESSRDIHLDSGEALFDVARDPSRPFRVWTGGSVIRAVGTRFNVYRAGDGVTVTVLEGSVAIGESATVAGIQLAAGEQARIGVEKQIRTARLAQPSRAVAWQSRRLIFEGEPLSQVIAELNRYNEKPLELAEPSLASKRIHGVFDARDRESLIKFLQAFEDVKVEDGHDGLIVRRRLRQ